MQGNSFNFIFISITLCIHMLLCLFCLNIYVMLHFLLSTKSLIIFIHFALQPLTNPSVHLYVCLHIFFIWFKHGLIIVNKKNLFKSCPLANYKNGLHYSIIYNKKKTQKQQFISVLLFYVFLIELVI